MTSTPISTRRRSERQRSPSLTRAATLAIVLPLLLGATAARAQSIPADLGFSFLQERTKFVGTGTDRYFMLRGAKVDFGYSLYKRLGLTVSGTGLATVNLRGSLDVEEIAFSAGPRYTWNWGHITPTASSRKGGVYVEGKIGYTIATSGAYPVNGTVLDHASALTYIGGAGWNLHAYDRFDLRPIEVEYVRKHLPNGGTDVQNSIRLGAGINFHFGM